MPLDDTPADRGPVGGPSRLIRMEVEAVATMSSEHTNGGVDARGNEDGTVVPAIVEWLIAALLAIGGLAMALGGSAVLWASGDEVIAEAIREGMADGTVQSDVLTAAELTTIATNTAFWLGVGLVVTGLATVAVAVVYVLGRRRTRRAAGDGSEREVLFAHALLGAVATGVLQFVPVSPILGGAVAGYLHRDRANGSTRAGAVSGLLASLPLVSIVVFVAVGLVAGFLAADVSGIGVVVAIAMLIALLAVLVYFVGLGALGGFLADAIADDDRPNERGAERHVDAATEGTTDPRGEDEGRP